LPPRFRGRRYSDGMLPFKTFPDFVDCCHVSQQTDGRDLSSRFRDMMCPRPLVSRIREMPNPEKPMNSLIQDFTRKKPDHLFSGFTIFQIPMCRWRFPLRDFFRVAGFAPRVQDRWTVLMHPRDIATCDALNLYQRETPNADMLTVPLMSAMCPVKNGRLRSYRDFTYRDFASCDVKFL
jgi:hypothetical protein